MGKRRQFHCLDGVLRDMLAAVTDDEGEGYDRLVSFVRIICDIIDVLEDDDDSGLPPTDGETGERPEPDMVLPDAQDSLALGRPAQGHDSRVLPHVGTLPGLGDPMERVRTLAAQAAGGDRRALAVARAARGRRLLMGA